MARRRARAHALVSFALWPLCTALGTAIALGDVPYSLLSLPERLGLGVLGVLLWAPDVLVFGALAWMSTFSLASLAARAGWLPSEGSARRLAAEPILFGWAVFVGAVVHFPAALRHPLLTVFDQGPAALVLALVVFGGTLLAGWLFLPGFRARGLAVLLLLGFLVPWPAARGGVSWRRPAEQPPLVLLGLDSLAMTSALTPLDELATRHGGVFYQRAVTPGLITNAVWNSLLLGDPVSRHGVFFAGQPWPRPGERAPLLVAASAAGYDTIAMIPDSSSCPVGAQAGFDEDRGGPLGWRQILLPPASDASLFLSLLRPLLPRLPGSSAPPNLAGTFTYDLDRDLREILTAGRGARPAFVAAHTAYLHMKAFPRRTQLTSDELRVVARSRLSGLLDRSFDWLDHDRPDDPIPLHAWKQRRLLDAVVAAVEQTGFLTRGGRLVLFSDHGERAGITLDNFADPRFFHVPLLTFHLPARDPDAPISLLDLGNLLGLTTERAPALAVVEYAMPPTEAWGQLLRHTRTRWDGGLETDPAQLAPAFADLRTHQPWP